MHAFVCLRGQNYLFIRTLQNPVPSSRSFGTSYSTETVDTTDSCPTSVSGQACTLAIMKCLTKLLNELAKKTEPVTKSSSLQCNSSSPMIVNQPKLQVSQIDRLYVCICNISHPPCVQTLSNSNCNLRKRVTGVSAKNSGRNFSSILLCAFFTVKTWRQRSLCLRQSDLKNFLENSFADNAVDQFRDALLIQVLIFPGQRTWFP